MIGDGWDGGASVRPGEGEPDEPRRRRIAIVTGSRAEFGLLRPVMHAVAAHPELELLVIAAGSHLIQPAETFREVKRHFAVADSVPMQIAGRTTRADDAEALGRGVARFTRSFESLRPDWVVVLGDRIEAFAAAAAASIGGWALAHIHGGDRAEGIADEAMRHAITKLAHLHFPATAQSARRIASMGERPGSIHAVGSPAIDAIIGAPPAPAEVWNDLGQPTCILLLHPIGRTDEQEEAAAAEVIAGLAGERVVALHPNHDPGRAGIMRAIQGAPALAGARAHLAREVFVGALLRLATMAPRGVLVGNSSAGLIEASALRCPVVDIGPRQRGRERVGNVVHVELEHAEGVRAAVARARALDLSGLVHPYGDGRAGQRIAGVLAATDPATPGLLRKCCAF